VEREYRADDEAPLIAGVFFNRLEIGMGLQSCATVEYVITEIEGKPHPEVLYNRDIAIQDPYNTYVYAGLPPGPISCPGAVALNAAFHPTASDYLYFRLMDPQEGRHKFSKTLEDHIKAGVFTLNGAPRPNESNFRNHHSGGNRPGGSPNGHRGLRSFRKTGGPILGPLSVP